MYKYKHIIISALIAVLVFASCEKWLDLKPENDIIKQEFWQSKQQVHAAVIGCYAAMQESDLVRKVFLWSELRGDMLLDNILVSTNSLRILEGDITPLNSVVRWNSFYRAINICNTVIDYAKNALQTDETFTQAELKAYEAEALALRSLLYFYLVRSFGEVPLMIESVTSDQDEFFIPKSTEQEIIDQLLLDLDTAATHAVDRHQDIATTKGRITKYAIHALQADIYLWNEQYDKCVEACDKIIASENYGLVAANNWFEDIFVNGNSNESIFELQFDEDKRNPFYDYFYPNKEFVVNPLATQLYEDQDVRGDSCTYWFTNEENPIIYKQLGLSNQEKLYRPSGMMHANWIFYRYADVLLMKAEALAQLQRGDEALGLLNLVQKRANATLSVIDSDDYVSLSDAILLERQKELAYEGKRWYDVFRNARRNNYTRADGSSGKDIIISIIEMAAPADQIEVLAKRYSDPRSHFFPIYYRELETNNKLVQNSYYLQ